MKTRLPRALAALGVALLLSSIEAEGKMLLLLLWQVTLKNSRKEKTYLLCFCCLLCFLCTSPVTSLLQRNVLFLRCVYSQAFRSSSSSSPVLYSAVWSLCACLQCAVHTVAFPEDQFPWRGQQLHPVLPRGSWRAGYQEPQNMDILTGSTADHLGRDCDLGDNMK